jgi:hypothetical protein
MAESFEFDEYVRCLRAEIADVSSEPENDGYRVNRFTRIARDVLADYGVIEDAEVCYFHWEAGRGHAKSNAWHIDETEGRLDLFTTVFLDTDSQESPKKTDIERSIRQALQVHFLAIKGVHSEMEPSSDKYGMMRSIYEARNEYSQVRIFLITDGLLKNTKDQQLERGDTSVDVYFWDVQRLFRVQTSGRKYDALEIDFRKKFNRTIPCLEVPETGREYSGYLAIIQGQLLAEMYEEYGSRLLELNVRSFLQTRGKVNKGIRNTIMKEPGRFLAYNNGITATVENLDTEMTKKGMVITRVSGLQVVNGGQTVASIHRTMKADRADLSKIAVQAKITVVLRDLIDELVPAISRYSNTQNKVNEADFASNDPFHVRIEQLADTIWTPGEQTRWFYERARGQYEVARNRRAKTQAQKRQYDRQQPRKQKFTKTDLAKYFNSWEQNPHIVSLGTQKNFITYMAGLKNTQPDFIPDPDFYRQLISRAILFKEAEKIARSHKFPAFRANAVTYTIALISFKTLGRLSLDSIWQQQEVSAGVRTTLEEWMPMVWEEIRSTAGERNVTEWAKKKECWEQLQLLDVPINSELEGELSEGDPLPTVGRAARKGRVKLSSIDRHNIALVMQCDKVIWRKISDWGQETGLLEPWEFGIALTLSGYAAGKWKSVPSVKQAKHGAQILEKADSNGILNNGEDM